MNLLSNLSQSDMSLAIYLAKINISHSASMVEEATPSFPLCDDLGNLCTGPQAARSGGSP